LKNRIGFVSNSSSTSFVIDARKYPHEKIKNYIEKLLEAENDLEGESYTLDDICMIVDGASIDIFNNQLDGYFHSSPIEHDGPIVLVESRGDNSIPWSIQEALENIALRRQHWG
jgi:hypothetical protein